MTKRLSFLVHGEVQAFGKYVQAIERIHFPKAEPIRYFTQKKAISYGLTGWIKNTSNSKVEGEAQGDEDNLQKLMKDVDSGPTHAHVVKVEKSDIDIVEGETSFEVRE